MDREKIKKIAKKYVEDIEVSEIILHRDYIEVQGYSPSKGFVTVFLSYREVS